MSLWKRAIFPGGPLKTLSRIDPKTLNTKPLNCRGPGVQLGPILFLHTGGLDFAIYMLHALNMYMRLKVSTYDIYIYIYTYGYTCTRLAVYTRYT